MQPSASETAKLPATIVPGQPITALAPMQDVTDLPFMRAIGDFGPPDYFVTEYFRVHVHSTLEKHIVASITDHGTGRPVFAQMIGEDLDHMRRTVEALLDLPIAGIDLNMGCPAPKVYKKNVGGGLLRDPEHVDRLLGMLREASPGLFTVKCRIGFEDLSHYDTILGLFAKHRIDMLSVHGRTVKEMYRGSVHYDQIRRAVEAVPCPVLANGNISSAAKAADVLDYTGAAGVMIGRGAIRNPWIFRQCREFFGGTPVYHPTLGDVRQWITILWETTAKPGMDDLRHVARMKKFLNFVGQGVDPEGAFLKEMRRQRTPEDLFAVCDAHLVEGDRASMPFAEEPYAGVLARPNAEGPANGCRL